MSIISFNIIKNVDISVNFITFLSMVKIFPLIFIILWSSAFITTKPIIDNSDPFSALAFRFFLVAIGFYLFSVYSKYSIIVNRRNLIESFFSGVLFHGLYLGGVFYSISIGMPTGIAALIAVSYTHLTLPTKRIV